MPADAPPRRRGQARLWSYLLVLTLCWGSAFPLVRMAVAVLPPFTLSAARAVIAAMALAAFLWWRGGLALPDRRMLRHMVVLGTINGWLPNVLTALSLGRIESAQAALIQASGPLVTAGLAALLLTDERLAGRQIFGLGLGFAGVLMVLGPLALSGGGSLLGGLAMVGAAISYACGTIYVRRARPAASAPLVLGQQIASAVPAIVLALIFEPAVSSAQVAAAWPIVLALGLFGSAVPLTLYLHLLSFARAADASLVGYLQPVWAAILAAPLLGEWPPASVVAGGAVTLAGVWLTSARPTPRPAS